MAREYPRFLFSDPQDTKSKGPFVVHLLEPRFIARIVDTRKSPVIKSDCIIEVLEVFSENSDSHKFQKILAEIEYRYSNNLLQ